MAQKRAALNAKASAFLRPMAAFKTMAVVTVSCLALLPGMSNLAYAHSISEALTRFYQDSAALRALQLGVSSQNEASNQASAAALPQVTMTVGANPSRRFSYSGRSGTSASDSADLSMNLSVSQAVDLSGSIGNQIRSALLGLENGWVAYYAQEQMLMLEAVNVYMTAITARASVALNNGATTLLEAQVRAARARFDAGLGTSTDIANINASLQAARASLAQAVGGREIADANFRRVFGIDPHNLVFPTHVPNLPRSMHQAIDRAMLGEQALIQAEAAVQIAELNVKAARARTGPSMQLSASAGHNWDLMRSGNDHSTSFSAGGQVTVPIYEGGAASSRIRQAMLDLEAAKARLEAQRAQTRANVISAWQNLQSAEATLNSTVAQVEAAELALRGARAEQDAGTKTFLDTLDAENALTTAQVSLSTTRSRVVLAGYSLLQATGDLTAEKLRLPVGNYFVPETDLDIRQVKNFATAIYIDGAGRETTTPSFVRWVYNNAAASFVSSAR